jgi:hypothetical protein
MSANPSGHGGRPFTKNDPRAKPYPKGTSGNPSGRPRSLSHYILQQTDDGKEIVDLLVLIMRKGSLKFRMNAAKELLDRALGRPVMYHALRHQEDYLEVIELFCAKGKELFGQEGWDKVYEAAREAIEETGNQRKPY